MCEGHCCVYEKAQATGQVVAARYTGSDGHEYAHGWPAAAGIAGNAPTVPG